MREIKNVWHFQPIPSVWRPLAFLLPILHVEVLNPLVPQNVTVFGDSVFKEAIKLKWNHTVGSYSNRLEFSYKETRKVKQKEEHVRTQREDGVYKATCETSEENNPADTLTSDFQPPGLWGYKFLLFKSPTLWSLYGSPSTLQPPLALCI